MKKLVFLFSAIALLVGCDKFEEEGQITQNGTTNDGLPELLYATIADESEDSQTRTYIDNNLYVLWHEGDAISYFSGENHNYQYTNTSEDGAKNATFGQPQGGTTGTNVSGTYAVYPYSNDISYSDGKLNITYPAEQTYAENSFGEGANMMVATSATSNDSNLSFRNAGCCLVVKLYGEGVSVKSVKLTALGEGVKIAGPATITTDSNGAPVVTMGEGATSEITLDCYNGGDGITIGAAAEAATEFWFALPPTTFEGGFELTVTSMDDKTFVKNTTKDITIGRNEIQPMAALKFVSSTPEAHQLFYTTSDGQKIEFNESPFNAVIESQEYENDRWVITFNSAPTSINENAFYEKTNLTSVTMPDGISFIGNYAFAGTGLTEITMPDSVTNIGDYAFYNCNNLTSAALGNGVETLGTNVFNLCTALESIIIPANVTNIGVGSFVDCESLSSVVIEESATPLNIGCMYSSTNSPFGDSPLSNITVLRNMVLVDEDGNPFEELGNTLGMFVNDVDYNEGAITTVTLGGKLTKITDYMFSGVRMATVRIPSSVTYIGIRAFHSCEQLYKVTLDHSTPPTLGSEAFDACILTTIAIKVGTKSLYEAATNWKDLPDKYENANLFVEEVE